MRMTGGRQVARKMFLGAALRPPVRRPTGPGWLQPFWPRIPCETRVQWTDPFPFPGWSEPDCRITKQPSLRRTIGPFAGTPGRRPALTFRVRHRAVPSQACHRHDRLSRRKGKGHDRRGAACGDKISGAAQGERRARFKSSRSFGRITTSSSKRRKRCERSIEDRANRKPDIVFCPCHRHEGKEFPVFSVQHP